MAIEAVSLSGEQIGLFYRTERSLQEQKAASLNTLAEEVISGGGYCDEGTFLLAFYANYCQGFARGGEIDRRSFLSLPKPVRKALKHAFAVDYSVDEPFYLCERTPGFADYTKVGVIAVSEVARREDTWGAVDFQITSDDNMAFGGGYTGRVAFNVWGDRDRGGYADRNLSMGKNGLKRSSFDLLRVTRPRDTTTSEVTRTYKGLGDVAIGIPAIRRSVVGDSGYIYDGMMDSIEGRLKTVRAQIATNTSAATIT